MPFTNLDKALCDRLARGLHAQAKMLLTLHGSNWQASKDSRKAKLEFDRLERDARDAGLLAKRMVGEEKQRRMAEKAATEALAKSLQGDGALPGTIAMVPDAPATAEVNLKQEELHG